jgi:hypothetical protein
LDWKKITLAVARAACEIDGFDIYIQESSSRLKELLSPDEYEALMLSIKEENG